MRARTAERLLARSGQRQPDGTRPLRARLAWHRLTRAVERGTQAAVDAAWRRWLHAHDEELWALLQAHPRPAMHDWDTRNLSRVALGDAPIGAPGVRTALALAMSRLGHHPIADIAAPQVLSAAEDRQLVDEVCEMALQTGDGAPGAFCAQHHLTPGNPVRRAVFYLLTGQLEQLRAHDPDGSLLAVGYESARDQERERMRAAMVGAGDLDVLRVLAGDRRDRLTRMTADEVGYLAAQLADRQEWAELWQLAKQVSPTAAVRAARLLPEQWRPADDRDHALLELLVRADPEQVGAARGALSAPLRIPVAGEALGGAFSPDGQRLAVAVASATARAEPSVKVLDVASGTVLEEYSDVAEPRLLYLFNNGTLVYGAADGLRWCTGGHVKHVWKFPGRPVALAPRFVRRGGLVVATPEGLNFLDRDGKLTGHAPRWRLNLPFRDNLQALAAQPGGSLLAAASSCLLVLDAAHARRVRLLSTPQAVPHATGICFAGPDRVVVTQRNSVSVWRQTGQEVSLAATTGHLGSLSVARAPVWIPHRDEIAVLAGKTDTVLYLRVNHDSASLEIVKESRELDRRRGSALWASPSSQHHALGTADAVEVVLGGRAAAIAALADRPLAAAAPADLRTVAAARRDPVVRSLAGPLLDLLWDCLRHRFATEVGLGENDLLLGDDFDIALAPAEGTWVG